MVRASVIPQPKKDYEVVENLLRNEALTPEEIQRKTSIPFSRLARILPSVFNTNPILPVVQYLSSRTERLFASMQAGFDLFVDHGFVWRYFTIYSYNLSLILEAIELNKGITIFESRKRLDVASELMKSITRSICDIFKLKKSELGKIFLMGVRGSTIRLDAKSEDDIDIFISFSERLFPANSQREVWLKYLILYNILKIHKKHKIHISLQAVSDSTFLTQICADLKDLYIAFFFFTTQPIFGEHFYARLFRAFKKTRAYVKVYNKLRAARAKQVTFETLMYDLTHIHKTDREREQLRAKEMECLEKELDRLREVLSL